MTHDDFLDPSTAERLLSGAVPAADSPPGYGPVAAVLAAAAAPGSVPDMDFDELARVARRAAAPSGPSPTRRSPMIGKLLTAKAAAVAGVVLISATGAAAATGSLPSAVQRVAHSTLSHVGVDVPDDDAAEHQNDPSNHDDQKPDDPTTTTTVPAADPVATVPPTDNHGQDGTDTATDDHGQDPTDANGEHGQTDDQSGDHHDGGSTGTTPTTVPVDDDGSGSGDSGHGDSSHGDSGAGDSGSGHSNSEQHQG